MNLYLILLFSLTTLFLQSYSSPNDRYDACSKNLTCGSLGELSYPFYDGSTRPEYCGYPGFKIDCSQGIPYITISDQEYHLKAVNYTDRYSIRISRNDTWRGGCPDSLTNTTMDFSKFNFPSATQNITFFYYCEGGSNNLSGLPLQARCSVDGHESAGGYYLTEAMMEEYKSWNLYQSCEYNLVLPISKTVAEAISGGQNKLGELIAAFEEGFELGLIVNNSVCDSCIKSDGVCGYDWGSERFVCHCADADYKIQCGAAGSKEKMILVAVGTRSFILGIIILYYIYSLWRCKSLKKSCIVSTPSGGVKVSKNEGLEELLQKYESLVPRRYTYANITKMTNSFREKLGEGGYGKVFKGKLQDGRDVAVKVSKESKDDKLLTNHYTISLVFPS